MRNTEQGMDLMRQLITDIEGAGTVESQPRLVGRNIGMLLAPVGQKGSR